ncbi:transglutaminase domain-containing protein [Micromonospora sp. LOL_024]|uniref:transglutaminase domain-containing protein n=1 Tax=Micromonospora sp. LOL_024 TaxID=3345412 RepID=UPI003A8BBD9C
MTDRLEAIVAPILRIPPEYRRYHVSAAEVGVTHGVNADLLARLVDLGVPHVGAGDDALFDENDVAAVALRLGLPSVHGFTMRFWLKSLRRLQRTSTVYRVGVQADCPAPRHGGTCAYRVLDTDGSKRDFVTGNRRERVGSLRLSAHERPYELPQVLLGLVGEFADVDLYPLPTAMRHDAAFLTEFRAGPCTLFTDVLVAEARRRGLAARTAYGIIVAAPYSQPHSWAEILVEDRWLKVDPQVPRSLQSFGLCTEDDWPQTLSPAGLYHRLAAEPPLVSHSGLACQVSLPTTVAS